jgi:hypothetical protein
MRMLDCGGGYGARLRPARLGALGWVVLVGALAGALALQAACGSDLILAAGDLSVVPDPAHPGDSVKFIFNLTLVPKHDYIATVLIDDREHSRVSRSEAINGPVELNIGDAAELIARYGTGTHRGVVEIELTGRSVIARSGRRDFVLEAASP